MTYVITSLQAVGPGSLKPADGITVTLDEARDSMGFPTVNVYGPTRAAVINYVLSEWGDDDPKWFAEYVVGRVTEVPWKPTKQDGDYALGPMPLNERIDWSVDRGKREILNDIADGTLPADISSFSDLHDHVDANEYGGLCLPGHGLSDADWRTWGVEVQNQLDAWLKVGKP